MCVSKYDLFCSSLLVTWLYSGKQLERRNCVVFIQRYAKTLCIQFVLQYTKCLCVVVCLFLYNAVVYCSLVTY